MHGCQRGAVAVMAVATRGAGGARGAAGAGRGSARAAMPLVRSKSASDASGAGAQAVGGARCGVRGAFGEVRAFARASAGGVARGMTTTTTTTRRGAATTARGGGSNNAGGGGNGGGGGGGGGSGGNNDGGSGSSNGSSSLWGAYLQALEKHPLATKCATSGFLNALGDLFAQFMFDDAANKGVDFRRAGVFTFLGAVLVGPALHLWYGTLGKLVTVKGSAGAAISLILDQGVFAPAFLCVFLSSLFTIEGMQDQIVPKLKQDFASTVVANWKIWIPFQFLNFRFVPLNLQVAAANVVALLWNTYLSWASHKTVVEVAPAGGKKAKK